MLKVNRSADPFYPDYDTGSSSTSVKATSVLAVLGRRRRLTLGIIAGCIILSLAFSLTSTVLFTATADVLIDARRVHADEGSAGNRSLAELGMDSASIDSQVAVLKSEAIATKVMQQLHLENDASFAEPVTLPGRIMESVRVALRGPRDPGPRDGIPAAVLDGFLKSFDVKRVQQTYILSLSFSDRSPVRAAAIVNAFATTYADEQIEATLRSNEASAAWVRTRLSEATGEVAAAEQALRSLQAEVMEGLAGAARSDTTAASTPGSQDRMRDLERALDTRKSLYESLVGRAQAAVQRQAMPVSSVVVLSQARPPLTKSRPNTLLILVLGAIAGFAFALGIAMALDVADRTLRVPSDVEKALRLPFIGLLPRTRLKTGTILARGSSSDASAPLLGIAAADASSSFAETLRIAKVAANAAGRPGRVAVIGVASVERGEGRSTVAANLADVFAANGRRVLLVDADIRKPTLSVQCAPERRSGLVEVGEGSANLDDSIVRQPRSRVDFLPASGGEGRENIGALIELTVLDEMLANLQESYDTVVLDLPPLTHFTEVAAAAPRIDCFLLVAAWGKTRRDLAGEALRANAQVADRTFGVVLNMADLRASRRMTRGARDSFFLSGADQPRPKTA